MNNVTVIHHLKALTVAHHTIRTARVREERELSTIEMIEIEVAIKMMIDDLTREAVKS